MTDDTTRTDTALDDLAAIPPAYRACRVLLTPGREPAPDWVQSDKAAAEAARAAKADRAAAAYNAQHRITTPGASPAPLNLAVLADVIASERLILGACATIRTRLGVTPTPAQTNPAERPTRFLTAVAWLRTAGIHATTGPHLARAARDITRARHHLDRHAQPADITIRLDVPCPACDRLSLRAHPAVPRESSYVACISRACQSMWPYPVWGTLGGVLGPTLATLAAG